MEFFYWTTRPIWAWPGPSELAYKVTETKVIQELTDAKNQKQKRN